MDREDDSSHAMEKLRELNLKREAEQVSHCPRTISNAAKAVKVSVTC